jgi:hypothetical protein
MEIIAPAATIPSYKQLQKLCPVKDKRNYFKKMYKVRPRLYWTADLMLVLKGNALRATNVVNLVAAIYRPPVRRLRGDIELATELSLLNFLPKAMMRKVRDKRGSVSHLLYPFYWIDTTLNCNIDQHWDYFTNDDYSGIEHNEPYFPTFGLFARNQ